MSHRRPEMTHPAILILSFMLVACSSSGKGGTGGSGGWSASGGAGGQGGSAGPTGGASGGDGCAMDATTSGCFLHGSWQIDNLSPCFFSVRGDAGVSSGDASVSRDDAGVSSGDASVSRDDAGVSSGDASVSRDDAGVSRDDAGVSEGAISTIQNGQLFECPSDFTAAPTDTWSTNTLTTDCTGHYTLCYTLKAGSATNPQASDCVVIQVCTEGDYLTANQPQPWPDLPGWISTGDENACAKTFTESGGYGVKSVSGTPTGCASITKTLGTVTYCPLSCNQPNPPSLCATCVSGNNDGGF